MKSHRTNPMEKDGDESGTVGGIAMRSPPLLSHRTRSRMGNDKNRKGEILYLPIMLASICKKDGPWRRGHRIRRREGTMMGDGWRRAARRSLAQPCRRILGFNNLFLAPQISSASHISPPQPCELLQNPTLLSPSQPLCCRKASHSTIRKADARLAQWIGFPSRNPRSSVSQLFFPSHAPLPFR